MSREDGEKPLGLNEQEARELIDPRENSENVVPFPSPETIHASQFYSGEAFQIRAERELEEARDLASEKDKSAIGRLRKFLGQKSHTEIFEEQKAAEQETLNPQLLTSEEISQFNQEELANYNKALEKYQDAKEKYLGEARLIAEKTTIANRNEMTRTLHACTKASRIVTNETGLLRDKLEWRNRKK